MMQKFIYVQSMFWRIGKKNVIKEYSVINLRSEKYFGKYNKFCILALSTKKRMNILLNVLKLPWIRYLKSITYPSSRTILKNTTPRYMVSHSDIFIFKSYICIWQILLYLILFLSDMYFKFWSLNYFSCIELWLVGLRHLPHTN